MAALIGALRATLSADTANFEAGMKRAQRQAATSSSAISKSLGIVKAGIAGFASAITVGLVSNVIKNALDYAGSLGEVSQQLGVTTRDLQVFRYAAGQNGVAQEELDKGLGKLTITLGQVAAGAKAPTKALEAIGITAKDIAGLDTGAAFRKIADGLAQVTDRSQRAAVEVALFGRSGAKLDTLLAGGSAAINELANAAETLGIVLSDEQIQKADETADRLDALKTVLSAQIAGVVADNADSILYLANSFVTLVASIGNAIKAYSQFVNNIDANIAAKAYDIVGNKAAAARARGSQYESGVNPTIAGSSVTVSLAPAKPFKAPTAAGADIGKFLAGGGGGKKRAGGKDRSAEQAERARLDAIRDAYRFDEDMRRADMDTLRAKQSLSTDFVERARLSIQMLDLERAGFEAEQANKVALGEMTSAQAAQLQAKYDITDGLERQAVLQDEETKRQEIFNALEATSYQQQREMLEQQSGLAETSAERREVEMRILDLALQEARERQARLERESTDWQAIETGRRELAGMEQRQAGAREGVNRATRGPWEQYLSEMPNSAAKMEEAFQSVKVNAVDGLVQGLADAATGAQKLGDVFKSVAQQIIADLIKIQIQKMIVGALSSALGAIGGGSSLTTVSGGSAGASSTPIPSFATGGSLTILGRRGTDRNTLSLNGLPIANVSHGERLSVSNDNDGARGGARRQYFDLRGAVMTHDLVAQMNEIGRTSVAQGAMLGAAGGQQATMRQQRRQIP